MKALIDIPVEANQILNIIKAQFNLKNKSEAISLVVDKYKEDYMEPELRPEFVKKILRGENKKGIEFKSFKEIDERYR